MITEQELTNLLNKLEVKDRSKNIYFKRLLFLNYQLNPELKITKMINLNSYHHSRKIIKFMEKKWNNNETKKTYICAILNLLKITNDTHFKNGNMRPYYKKYKSYLDSLWKAINTNIASDEFKIMKREVDEDKLYLIIENQKIKFKLKNDIDNLQNIFLILVYLKNKPARADYADMLIIKSKTDDMDEKYNYAVIDDGEFIFYNYKTEKRGATILPIHSDVLEYVKLIYDFRINNNENPIFILKNKRTKKPTDAGSLSKKIIRLTGYGVNDFRKHYASKPENMKIIKEAVDMADGMMTSAGTLIKFYNKNKNKNDKTLNETET